MSHDVIIRLNRNLWLTEGPWVDENVLDALRKVRPGNLREEDIISFKYQLKY